MGRLLLAVLSLAVMSAACSGDAGTLTSTGGTTTNPSPAQPTGATAADLAFCVTETNRYRTLATKPPLSRSAALETYAAAGAQADAIAHVAHSHFANTNGGGLAVAETELLATLFTSFGTVQEAIRQTLANFYAQGPSGADYQVLVGPYTELGCGVFISSSFITFVQDFR